MNDVCFKDVFKYVSNRFEGNRKTSENQIEFYFVERKHLGCISPRVCESIPMSKQYDLSKRSVFK